MKKRFWILPVILCLLLLLYGGIQRTHRFTLWGEDRLKSEEIQPLLGTVKVWGDQDTDVVFTDVETGEEYTIGYITPGVTGKIRLERGRWYSVAGNGTLTLGPVNVRIE